MATSAKEAGKATFERRSFRRIAITCRATLRTFSGVRDAELSDLSEMGAKLLMERPPERGETVVLKWRDEEVAATVAWSGGASCGLTFHVAISQAVVSATAGELGEEIRPVAAVGTIPYGRKRSAISRVA